MKLTHPDAGILIHDLPNGRRRVVVEPCDPASFIGKRECETSYSDDLLRTVFDVKGPAWLCDEIERDENPAYVADPLRLKVNAYVDERWFDGKRILDFGCGSGASTVILARLFPHTEIVGVELDEGYLRVAQARAAFHKLSHVRFLQSPRADALPTGIGRFDAVMLSAVYEHLLPRERPLILALLWASLKPGGLLFITETPHRYYPIEGHTTGLPFIGYLPDQLALQAARRFSARIDRDQSWETLLRMGIRGGTEGEILRWLRKTDDGVPVSLLPSRMGLHDHADLYHARWSTKRWVPVKKALRLGFKLMCRLTGSAFVPELMLAIEKRERHPRATGEASPVAHRA